ncbi:MAG TPA: transglutaminase domain-containing protein [Patescibacteria group bacterium]|nr:transglutaminase domain-containing protein [Patescibacteria group bacterium]
MSAGVITAGARTVPQPRSMPLRPAEGWLTLLATVVMVMVLGGSLQDAAWTPDSNNPDVNFLPWVGLIGVAWGVFGAKVGWGRWRTHILGALIAGLILPLIVGGIALGPDANVGWDPAGMARRLVATLGVAQNVWRDLVIIGKATTGQYAHYHLVFGVIVWGAGILAGFTVFGHRRPLDAVVVVGLAIIANMALTTHPQLTLMVIFSAAALLLLIRTHVFEEELTWSRRKIGDPGTVGQLYLRGGAAFVTATILASVVLTATASSAPLQGVWADLPKHLQGLQQLLLQIGPPAGDPRGLGTVGFGKNAKTGGLWQPSDSVAFRVQLQPGETKVVKWRAGTYAEYTRFGWTWGDPESTNDVAARDLQAIPAGEPGFAVGRREFFARITPEVFRENTIISPNELERVDRTSRAISVGGGDYFTAVESDDSLNTYNITAAVPVLQDVQGGITEARLRQAGTNYGAPELVAIYTALPKDAMGPASTQLLADIRRSVNAPADVDPNNPYDLARAMEQYLASPSNFRYDPDVRPDISEKCGGDVSSVECFALMKAGYCEYYASAMTVMLRWSHIPARVAYGFLPGKRGNDNLEVVSAASAHWWVEVYFPGTGWVEFDPTGQVGQPQPIPSGSVGPPTPAPTGIAPTFAERDLTPPPARVGQTTTSPGAGPFIAIAMILVIGVLALAYAAIRRAPSRPMHPDKAWGSMARLAARLGLGPRPSQTVFEYAGALGDEVPAVRVELTTLARAKVEVAYGRRDIAPDRMRRIAEAYHRLRLALLGLLLRRGLRGRRRR